MRPAILAVTAGSVLLMATACGSEPRTVETAASAPAPVPSAPAATTPARPDYSADTAKVCVRLKKIFPAELDGFGTAMGKMIAYKENKQTAATAEAEAAAKAAAAELKAIGTQIRRATTAARNPELKQAGATSAAKFERSARDRRYINRIRTKQDLDRTLEAQLEEWLTPVAGYCP